MSVFEGIKEKSNDAWVNHVFSGLPEADYELNGSTHDFIRAYAAEYSDAVCLNLKGTDTELFKPKDREKLYNFCANYIFDGANGNFEKVQKAVGKYKGGFEGLGYIFKAMKEVNAEPLLWS